jgi:threonine dehydrogenase-like Zn-dependent dehydrogenase
VLVLPARRFNLCTSLKLLGITPGLEGFADDVVLTASCPQRHRPRHAGGPQLPEGGLAETLASVLASHAKCATSLGESVVVLGAGPIGCLHVVIAHARGAKALVSEPNAGRRAGAEQFAPDAILDPSQQEVVTEVRRWTDGLGADVVVCANPVALTQTQAVEMARRGGRIVLFGGLPKANRWSASTPTSSTTANRWCGRVLVPSQLPRGRLARCAASWWTQRSSSRIRGPCLGWPRRFTSRPRASPRSCPAD